MEFETAVKALSALGQDTRLAAFRLLIAAGPNGMPAGEIARRLNVAPSTMSAHLAQLQVSGLIRHTRQERHLLYAVEIDGVRRLLGFLTEDCCQGRPELCGGLGAAAQTENTDT
jgi:DNA-binding transcriptional ArsR family regulator